MQQQLERLSEFPAAASSPKYFCVYCDPSPYNYWFSYSCVEKVHAHWLSNHTELHAAKPFQFYAIESVECVYCKCAGIFKYVKIHHQKTHSHLPFVVQRHRNAQQCAMCLYRGPDLASHFQQQHTAYASSDGIVFNPVCLTPDFLVDMLQNDVHQRFQCVQCGAIFETDHEAKRHCFQQHGNLKDCQVVQQAAVPNGISHVVCSVCGAEVQSADLLNHMLVEGQALGHSIDELYSNYMKTKVVFINGFVVFKANVVCSVYDDSKQIVQLFQNGRSSI